MPTPTFFKTPAAFRAWLAKHAASESELYVGFYKVDSGKPSMTWPESVDEALCFGWIDARRHSLDERSYMIRFTSRKPTSSWSAVNIAKMAELEKAGKMTEAGRAAFALRSEAKALIYSHEHAAEPELSKPEAAQVAANAAAAKFLASVAPSYRKAALFWVVGAKQATTRQRRLEAMIECSARGERLKHLTPPAKRKP